MSVMSELDMDRQSLERLVWSGSPQRRDLAVAALVGECEALVASARLTAPAEQSLRLLIAETLSAFNMEPHQEAVQREMAR